MSLQEYRLLIALRYAAEAVDEVNVFLARSFEIHLRLRREGALDRIVGYFGGTAAALATAYSIGGDFVVPSLALAAFLVLMGVRAVFGLISIEKQRRELTLDYESIRDYLRKATRDREQNRVSIAIQNRKAAARLLEQNEELDVDEKLFLQEAIQFWGRRILACKEKHVVGRNSEIWRGHEGDWNEVMSWIDTELEKRPLADASETSEFERPQKQL